MKICKEYLISTSKSENIWPQCSYNQIQVVLSGTAIFYSFLQSRLLPLESSLSLSSNSFSFLTINAVNFARSQRPRWCVKFSLLVFSQIKPAPSFIIRLSFSLVISWPMNKSLSRTCFYIFVVLPNYTFLCLHPITFPSAKQFQMALEAVPPMTSKHSLFTHKVPRH